MTREIKTTNRRKDEIETSQGKLTVGRNHEGGEYNSVEDTILYMYDYSRTVTIGLAEAKRLHAAIGEVIADAEQIIEDAKPKLLTDSELLALKRGTIVEFPEGSGNSYAGTKWMRLGWGGDGNDFVKLNTELVGSMNSAWALRDKLIVSTKEEN